jgi:hypothetical protein
MHLMQRGQQSASIRRSIAGIASIHTLSGNVDPTKDTEVKLTMRRMQRQIGRYQHQAHGINKDICWQPPRMACAATATAPC